MKILGIDPGYNILGWAVIEHNLKVIDYGTIQTDSGINIEERLYIIHNSLKKIIEDYQPESAAIERLFFSKNSKTAIDVAKCIGVIILTAKLAGLNFIDYGPSQVKLAITGYGKASKKQMQTMIMKIFKTSSIPEPDDAADALAIAACHSFYLTNPNRKIYNNDCKTKG